MSITLTLIEIPLIGNLRVVDQCTTVTVDWERSCRDLSYNVTLSSSDGVTLGPFTTSDTAYNFTTNVDTINGDIYVVVVAFNDNALGQNSSPEPAIIGILPTG